MLKQQQGYVLSKIGPHTYLLPYGQHNNKRNR